MFNPITIMLINHPVMMWKTGDCADAKNHKRKNRNITGGVDGGNTRQTRGVDDAEFFPLPDEESPRSSPGGRVR